MSSPKANDGMDTRKEGLKPASIVDLISGIAVALEGAVGAHAYGNTEAS
jgi:hypothetical protein